MTTLRFKMVEEAIGRKAVEVKAPAERPAEYFGKYVFDRDKMRKYLPKACFETLMNTMKNGSPLDRETADCVAAGMKQWAQDMGATHYTHWFQPLTGGTAEVPADGVIVTVTCYPEKFHIFIIYLFRKRLRWNFQKQK